MDHVAEEHHGALLGSRTNSDWWPGVWPGVDLMITEPAEYVVVAVQPCRLRSAQPLKFA